jgi:hypothetical protein
VYRAVCAALGMVVSTSGKGDCYDAAAGKTGTLPPPRCIRGPVAGGGVGPITHASIKSGQAPLAIDIEFWTLGRYRTSAFIIFAILSSKPLLDSHGIQSRSATVGS